MASFLFVYRQPVGGYASLTPDEIQQEMQRWMKWIEEGFRSGWMVDAGDALTQEGRVVTKQVVTDGPFVESKEIVGGYSIVKADSLDVAAELAKSCPATRGGGKVEVRPLAGLAPKS
jgi:hypothetical protein